MNGMHNFGVQKQRAINQINEMQKRATPPKEKPISDKNYNTQLPQSQNKQPTRLSLPFNDDTLIVLGLILILQSENCDMLLILALAYILM